MPRPQDPRNPGAGWIYRATARAAFSLMALQRWQWQLEGTEHLPRTGGAVIAANHTSFVDYFAAGRGPYLGLGRPIRILAKASLFRAPLFGRLMRATGMVPVERGAGSPALASAVELLRAGEVVLVLPEQTISPAFELLPLKTGAARMAAQAEVPLVPAVSWGTHRFHTAGRRPRWSWRLPVLVRYGPALRPGPQDDPTEVTAELRTRMAALLDGAQRDYVHGTPEGAWWVPARLGGGAPTVEEAREHLESLSRNWTGQQPPDQKD